GAPPIGPAFRQSDGMRRRRRTRGSTSVRKAPTTSQPLLRCCDKHLREVDRRERSWRIEQRLLHFRCRLPQAVEEGNQLLLLLRCCGAVEAERVADSPLYAINHVHCLLPACGVWWRSTGMP